MVSLNPILVVDDEYADVSDLEDVLNRAGQMIGHPENIVTVCESCEEAVEFMGEQMQAGERISALITDNHIGTSNIDGDDFLRILMGKLLYCVSRFEGDSYLSVERFRDLKEIESYVNRTNDSVSRFIKKSFDSLRDYTQFSQYYYGNSENSPTTVMLCGHPREVNLTGIEDIVLIGKDGRFQESRDPCELRVLDVLREAGIFSGECVGFGIQNNSRLSNPDPKKKEYNPSSAHIKRALRKHLTERN